MKVYKLNDYDWWAGNTLEEVKKSYINETGVSKEEAFEEPYEVSEADMNKLKFYTTEHNDKGEEITRTFREELDYIIKEGQKFPCAFACMDW